MFSINLTNCPLYYIEMNQRIYLTSLAILCIYVSLALATPSSIEKEIADLEKDVLGLNNMKNRHEKISKLKRLEKLYETQDDSEDIRNKKEQVKSNLDLLSLGVSQNRAGGGMRMLRQIGRQTKNLDRIMGIASLIEQLPTPEVSKSGFEYSKLEPSGAFSDPFSIGAFNLPGGAIAVN